MSNSLDPDKARSEYVGPDLGPNCLQRVISSCQCHVNVFSNISLQLQLVITFKVSNGLDPGKARKE